MRFRRDATLLPGACFAPGSVDGEEGELARIVDRHDQPGKFGGHGGAGGGQAGDLFEIAQRLRFKDLALRVDLMSESAWY